MMYVIVVVNTKIDAKSSYAKESSQKPADVS